MGGETGVYVCVCVVISILLHWIDLPQEFCNQNDKYQKTELRQHSVLYGIEWYGELSATHSYLLVV